MVAGGLSFEALKIGISKRGKKRWIEIPSLTGIERTSGCDGGPGRQFSLQRTVHTLIRYRDVLSQLF